MKSAAIHEGGGGACGSEVDPAHPPSTRTHPHPPCLFRTFGARFWVLVYPISTSFWPFRLIFSTFFFPLSGVGSLWFRLMLGLMFEVKLTVGSRSRVGQGEREEGTPFFFCALSSSDWGGFLLAGRQSSGRDTAEGVRASRFEPYHSTYLSGIGLKRHTQKRELDQERRNAKPNSPPIETWSQSEDTKHSVVLPYAPQGDQGVSSPNPALSQQEGRGGTPRKCVTSVGQRLTPRPCNTMKVEIKRHLACELRSSCAQLMLRKIHLTNVSESIAEAWHWVLGQVLTLTLSLLRVINVKLPLQPHQ